MLIVIDGKPVSPWDLMQSLDADRFGEDIFDPKERARWCRAIMTGGLPYMWAAWAAGRRSDLRIAEIGPGDRVLLFGESLESCGFIDDVKALVGPQGDVTPVDIQQHARDMSIAGYRGKHGIVGTFKYDFIEDIPEEAYDVVLNLQGIEHAEDWTDAGRDFLRIMKPSRRLVMAYIFMVNKELPWADLHLQHLIDKIFSGMGRTLKERPYYSREDLMRAFDGMLNDMDHFEWLEVFWGASRDPRNDGQSKGGSGKMTPTKHSIALAAALTIGLSGAAAAQDYANDRRTFVVGFSAGATPTASPSSSPNMSATCSGNRWSWRTARVLRRTSPRARWERAGQRIYRARHHDRSGRQRYAIPEPKLFALDNLVERL